MTIPPSLSHLLSAGGTKKWELRALPGGLIHQTYEVKVEDKSFLLQSINKNIFKDPTGLIQNHLALYHHFQSPPQPFTRSLPEPLRFSTGDWLFEDDHQQVWRLCEFIPQSYTRLYIEETTQAEALSYFFAAFTKHAATMNEPNWYIPLPNFHDLELRYNQFTSAILENKAGRVNEETALINALRERSTYVDSFRKIRNSPDYLLRMMHHDAKLSNVLIDEKTNSWICPIDLDTVMPGYFFSDLGDMVRSICNSGGREDGPPTEATFRDDLYEGLLKGYRKGMQSTLSTEEEKQLDLAGPLMTYMQALRFLTDFLNGDVYYQVSHPRQNAERALNQFTLLSNMEAYLKKRGRLSYDG